MLPARDCILVSELDSVGLIVFPRHEILKAAVPFCSTGYQPWFPRSHIPWNGKPDVIS